MTAINSLIRILVYAIALCGILPLFPWLSNLPRVIVLFGLAGGLYSDYYRALPLKNWMLNSAAIPVFIFYALQSNLSNVVQPVTSFLIILLAIRLLGEKNSRHCLQIFALSLFCLASSSLFDLSLLFVVYLTLMLMMVAVSLVLLTYYDADAQLMLPLRELRKVVGVGLLMPLLSLPLLLLLFPIIPRTQMPMWNFLVAAVTAGGGMADKVEPGISATAGDSPRLAFRAEMPRQPQPQVYWRGVVFNRFDGKGWQRAATIPQEHPSFGKGRVEQVIYPEPGLSKYLVGMDAVFAVNAIRSRSYPDLTHELLRQNTRRQAFSVSSFNGGLLSVAGKIDRRFYTSLPEGISPRMRGVAADISRKAGSDRARLELIEQYYRNGGFNYSRQGLPTGADALDRFLFDTKQGHCEFFASTFAILSRLCDIPTRLVGGYLGGDYNDVGGYYLVTENLAHVWVEVYIEGLGWRRVDPSSFAANADQAFGGTKLISLARRLRMTMDSLDHVWNRTVINYDFESQLKLATNLEGRLHGLRPPASLKGLLKPIVLFLLAIVMITLFIKRKVIFMGQEERLLRRFLAMVARDGGVDVAAKGLFEIAENHPNPAVREFVDIYASAIYHDRRLSDDEAGRLKGILDQGF